MAVVKIYPKIEELCTVTKTVYCSEEGCSKIFSCESNLTLHLVKSHKKSHLWTQDIKEFYCPDVKCMYNAQKNFKTIKYLKQHYMKVHMPKTLKCSTCGKNFSTEVLMKSHQDYCGISFACCDCDVSYPCYETLKTHCRRKGHKILEKIKYKQIVITAPVTKSQLILPKPLETSNQESQTVSVKKKTCTKFTQVQNNKVDQFTQTARGVQSDVETQTVLDFNKFSQKHLLELESEQTRKSIRVQTTAVESRTSSCNTSFSLNDLDLTFTPDVEKNSFGTQTSSQELSYSSSTTTHDSIHTDTSDLLMYGLNENIGSLDPTFFNCNMETQTDFILEDELFNYCDFYSNMYTQTCDEILSNSVFNDTETQTVLNEMLCSVKSQTMMSTGRKNVELKDMANMETQTDTEFQIRLEEIHS